MRIVIVLLATAFLMPPLHADDVDLRFFENRVRPLLVEKCLDCHGPDPGRREGGLDLSTRESLLQEEVGGLPQSRETPARVCCSNYWMVMAVSWECPLRGP